MIRRTSLPWFLALLLVLLVAAPLVSAAPIVANHTTTQLSYIPKSALDTARSNLHIVYGHTSHGSQLITGMDGLLTFGPAPYGCQTYRWNSDGSGGALMLDDAPFSDAYDLGNPDFIAWRNATRDYLDTHPGTNVVIWSWCGQVSWSTAADITNYLAMMNQLESEYPSVKFVYMTGHLDGSGPAGNLNQRNEQIRRYVAAHDKILFDFADIESYDPDGLVNYMVLNADDGCNYNGGHNWATEWQASHVEGKDWYACEPAHTEALNGNRKAFAAWWLWSRLGGWNGTPPAGTTIANFAATPLTGAPPLTVQFTDLSTNAPTGWRWNFGDGNFVNATKKNPVHTYAATGRYTVSLEAMNAKGSNTIQKVKYLQVTSVVSPTLASVQPAGGKRGAYVRITNLSGTGFAAGAKVFLNRSGGASITATNVSVVSGQKITCTVKIPAGATIGPWNVTVVNANKKYASKANAFTVKALQPPTVNGITPAAGERGTSVKITNLSGTGFITSPKPTVQLVRNSVTIKATNVVVTSGKKITCTIPIPAGAAAGAWTVRVTNADGQVGGMARAFQVQG